MKHFAGKVVEGFRVGSRFGIATANLDVSDESLLEEGVYLVQIEVPNGAKKNGLLHWGKRKTFGSSFSAEVHILDFSEDIYGETLTVYVRKFLRPVQIFANADALFTQIEKDIQTAKKYFLRQEIDAQWKTLKNADYLEQQAVEKISHHDLFLNAQNVLVYAPIKNELDFVQKICSMFPSKKYFFPKVVGDKMQFLESKYDDLIAGAFGVLEPKNEAPKFDTDEPCFVFVPGQAFDKLGNRLGRGGGFYDKFLSELRKENKFVYTTAVIPKFAYFSCIPTEPHDQKVDEVILVE
ncbi:5-formyltetrahydrofolate cyclo-ligase [bacterium DOLZORAL124_38_8]|nr:MAG: 5-formyltetrahydrofolate cyclo-ligase [bacterium DOLZORAL124_38_8]